MNVVHRIMVTVALAALAMVTLASAAAAQTPAYPFAEGITCDTSTVTAGSSFECGARGFKPGSSVAVQATGETTSGTSWTFSTTVEANADGIAIATIQVRDNATGPASISFSGVTPGDEVRVLSNAAAVNVTQTGSGDGAPAPAPDTGDDAAPAPDTSDDDLSATGGDFTGGVLAVGALITVGVGLLLVTRRRHRVEV